MPSTNVGKTGGKRPSNTNLGSGQSTNAGAATSKPCDMLQSLRIHVERNKRHLIISCEKYKYKLGQELEPESRYLEYKHATSYFWSGKLRDDNKDIADTIEKNVVAFLNSEGGTLVLGVAEGVKNYVTGVRLWEKDEAIVKTQLHEIIRKVQPSVPENAYLVKIVPVFDKVDHSEKKVIEISLAQGPEVEYHTSRGDIYVRREASVQGPLQSSILFEFLRHRTENSCNRELRREVNKVKGESVEIEKKILRIREGGQEMIENGRKATENVEKIKKSVEDLRRKVVAIEEAKPNQVAEDVQTVLNQLFVSVEKMEKTLQTEEEIQIGIATCSTMKNNTQKAVAKQEKISKQLDKFKTKTADNADKLQEFLNENQVEVESWHKNDEGAMSSLQEKVANLKTMYKQGSKLDRKEATELLESAKRDSKKIKSLEGEVEKLEKAQENLVTETANLMKVVEDHKKEAEEWHESDSKARELLEKSIDELKKVRNEKRQQQNAQEDASSHGSGTGA